MARTTKAKRTKGANGAGDSVVVNFDLNDPSERRALEAARLLASKHGRRKQAILALLEAIYARYEITGELMTPAQIAAALSGQVAAPQRPPIGFTPAIGRQIAAPPAPQFSTSQAAELPHIEIETTGQSPMINWHEKMHNAASSWGFFDQ